MPFSHHQDEALKVAGLVVELSTAATVKLLNLESEDIPLASKVAPAAWVDDLAISIMCSAMDLLDKAALALEIMWNTFLAFAVSLNMKEGKSAFLPFLRGRWSRAGTEAAGKAWYRSFDRHLFFTVSRGHAA